VFRTILILLIIALGTDALVFSGAYTQAAWRTLQEYSLQLRGPGDRNQPAATPEAPK